MQSCGKCLEANRSCWLHSDGNTPTARGSKTSSPLLFIYLQKMAVSLFRSSPYSLPSCSPLHLLLPLPLLSATRPDPTRPTLRFLYLQYKLLIFVCHFLYLSKSSVLRTLLHFNGFPTRRHIRCCPSPVWYSELTTCTAVHYRSNTPSVLQLSYSGVRNTETRKPNGVKFVSCRQETRNTVELAPTCAVSGLLQTRWELHLSGLSRSVYW